jgi:peptidoglycan/xylan/chitin deacetylase (PgdA/CDA1 family)
LQKKFVLKYQLAFFIVTSLKIFFSGMDQDQLCKIPFSSQSFYKYKTGQAITTSGDTSIIIYLTFDDGPVKESEELVKIALKDSIPINLFVVGEKVFANDTMKRLFRSYFTNPFIEIGNHSFTHANKKYQQYYKNTEKVVEDFKLNADTLHLTNKIARLPGRNTWRINNKSRTDLEDTNAAADSLAAIGYSIFGWDLEWRYCSDSCMEVQEADLLLKDIENSFHNKKTFSNNSIILLAHDPMFGTRNNRQQLELFIQAVKKRTNYRFGKLDAYH